MPSSAVSPRALSRADEISLEFDEIEPVGRRYSRPLAGFAIAATVAVAAVFGLQQMTLQPDAGLDSTTPAVAEETAEDSYTVPDIDYFQRHSEFSSEVGNNNFDFRRVSAEVEDEAELEDGREEIEPPQEVIPADATE